LLITHEKKEIPADKPETYFELFFCFLR